MSEASATRARLLRALVLVLGLLWSTAAATEAVASSTMDGEEPKAASAEILQLPHAFRHQEHYSHRIEQAVNDFKRAQQLQEQQRANNNNSDVWERLGNGEDNNNNNNNSNNNDDDNGIDDWRRIDQQQQQQHHRRHEQHQKQQQKEEHQQHRHHRDQQLQLQQQQHHLRHHNRHHETWEQRVFPALRHQRHQQQQQQPARSNPTTTTTTLSATTEAGGTLESAAAATLNVTRALQTRLFDRDGLYSHAPAPSARTTRGPRSRHHYGNVHEAPRLGDRAFGDDAAALEDSAEPNRLGGGGSRFSLKLHEEDELKKPEVDREMEKKEDKNDDNEDDDYEYEDEDEENTGDQKEDEWRKVNGKAVDWKEVDRTEAGQVRANEFPAANADQAKVAVKRYSNPFRGLRTATVRHFETAYDDGGEYDNNNYSNRRNNNNNKDPGDSDEDAVDADEDDIDSDFPSEKWNRIEHVHHLRQQQHQRELQRQLHGGNNKYPASTTTTTAAGGKRLNRNDDEAENIFARNYIPGTLTRQKQDELGTLEAVKEARRQHQTRHMQSKALANAHAKQIFSEASCRVPQRRVERIQRDPTKIYTPHCTVLHRCGDDTGCCKSDRQTCAPKRTKSVDLYFFVKSINDKKGSIERLTFVNHTECHCVEKAKQQPAEYGGGASFFGAGAGGPVLRRATILNCNCPKLYEKILQEDGFCRCDCSSGNTGCDWLKRGMEHFSMMDRKCILEGRCKPPTCEYGAYIKKHGRCPRREEQLSAALGGPALRARSYH